MRRLLSPSPAGRALLALAVAVLPLLFGTGCAEWTVEGRVSAIWTSTAAAWTPTLVPPTATPTRVPPTATPRPTAAPRPTPAPAATPSAMNSRLQSILAKTVDVRGLALKRQVPVGFMTRGQLHTFLIQSFEKENAGEELEREKATLVLLDLLKEDVDLAGLSLGLLTEQVTGFYDFDSQELKLIDAATDLTLLDELTLAHEYVHAAQDQNFGIGDKLEKAKGDGEKALALQSLAEGDATLVMGMYAQKQFSREQMQSLADTAVAGQPDQSKLKSAPPVMEWELMFPYLSGMLFVAGAFQQGGLPAINRLYDKPPTTSEQILHPASYFAGDGPKAVEKTDVATGVGSGWALWGDDDVLGEFGLRSYLMGGLASSKANKAAEGWGGDRLWLLRDSGGRKALADVSIWDSPAEATEFFQAVQELRRTRPGGGSTSPNGNQIQWTEASRAGYAGVNGNRVVLVIGPDALTTQAIADRLRK